MRGVVSETPSPPLSCTKHYLRTVEHNGEGHAMRLSTRNPGCCSPCPPDFLHGRPPLNAFTELYPLADLFPALWVTKPSIRAFCCWILSLHSCSYIPGSLAGPFAKPLRYGGGFDGCVRSRGSLSRCRGPCSIDSLGRSNLLWRHCVWCGGLSIECSAYAFLVSETGCRSPTCNM